MVNFGLKWVYFLNVYNAKKKYRRIIPSLWFVLLLFMPGGAMAQENYRVSGVEFVGNDSLSDSRLKEAVSVYGTSAFKSSILGKESFLYSEDAINDDRERLLRFYQRDGFLNAEIENPELKVSDKKHKVDITFRIKENRPFILSGISHSYTDSVSSLRVDSLVIPAIASSIPQKMRRFRDADINSVGSAISTVLANNGHPYAEIEPVVSVDEQAYTASVDFKIKPGPPVQFGEITISDNDRISDRLIGKHVPFSSGDTFDRSLLDRAQGQIFSLGQFRIVTISAELSETPGKNVPVKIKVREAPRLSSKIGLGYGREDRIRVFLDMKILSFLEEGYKLNFYAKHSYLEPYHFSARLERPSFLAINTVLSLEPFVRRQREPGFLLNRFGGTISLWHRFSNSLNATIAYTLERINLDTASISGAEPMEVGEIDLYNKSSVSNLITFDNSDNRFSPREGLNLSLNTKVSGLGFGSDYDFIKVLADLRRYQPFWGMVIAAKTKFGGIESIGNSQFIPVEDRFFAGGANSIRGWARGRLGPVDGDDIPTGGRSLLEASLELRYPIYGAFTGVIFSDIGNVWSNSYLFRFDELRYSAGFGFRYTTPIGPIRLDLAQPIDDPEKTVQLHISVGQAF